LLLTYVAHEIRLCSGLGTNFQGTYGLSNRIISSYKLRTSVTTAYTAIRLVRRKYYVHECSDIAFHTGHSHDGWYAPRLILLLRFNWLWSAYLLDLLYNVITIFAASWRTAYLHTHTHFIRRWTERHTSDNLGFSAGQFYRNFFSPQYECSSMEFRAAVALQSYLYIPRTSRTVAVLNYRICYPRRKIIGPDDALSLGRPRHRRKDNIKVELSERCVRLWTA